MQLYTLKEATARAGQRLRTWFIARRLGVAFAACGCVLSVWCPTPARSQERIETSAAHSERADSAAVALAQPGTVTFRETPLAEVILILSEQWNVNIIAGGDVQGQVNGTFKNESLKSILDSILMSNGLQYRQIGHSLVVLPNVDIGGNRSNFRVEVLDAHVNSGEEMEELIAALRLQMSADGQLVPISATGKLTLLDTPERIAAVKVLLAQLAPSANSPPRYVSAPATPSAQPNPLAGNSQFAADNLSQTAIELRPQYILATDLQPPLGMLVGEANISLVAQENSLVVFGDAAMQRKAELLMQQLDKPRPQVRITGYIYDVDVGELEKLGVDWGQKTMSTGLDVNGVPNNMAFSGTGLLTPSAVSNSANTLSGVVTDTASTATAGAAGATAAAAGPVGGQFLFRTLSSGFELQALVQALEQTKGSRLLADPHITVVDRHLATFEAKTRIPIQQLTQTQQGGSIGSTSFVDAGITLTVTPRISNDGTIEMQLTPVFSTLVGYDKDGKPIIDERNASTVVRVNHGQALAIGGLRRKNTVETVKGIPGLMNIKYLGALFRTHETDVRESELLVFIMPEIVGYCGGGLPREMAALGVTQQQLSRISTAVDGPFTPDCKDKYCPQHNERPRIHNGLHDAGLIGNHDLIFIEPQTSLMVSPQLPPQGGPQDRPITPTVTSGFQFDENLPSVPAASLPAVTSPPANPLGSTPSSGLQPTTSSRRVPS